MLPSAAPMPPGSMDPAPMIVAEARMKVACSSVVQPVSAPTADQDQVEGQTFTAPGDNAQPDGHCQRTRAQEGVGAAVQRVEVMHAACSGPMVSSA